MKILISTTLEHYPDIILTVYREFPAKQQYKGYTVQGKEYILEYDSSDINAIIDLFINDPDINGLSIRRR